MSSIFISYRRSDSQDAVGRIFERLSNEFSPASVFRDLDSIPLGVPFQEVVKQTLEQCDVVLAVIGPAWASAAKANGDRRLDDPEDYVRIEIETALRLQRRVIPICVTNAEIPKPDVLPESLRPLCDMNGLPIRPDPDFNNDIEKLIRELGSIGIHARGEVERQETPATTNPSTFLAEGETFTATGRLGLGNDQLRLPKCERLFLRLIPRTQFNTIRSSMVAKDLAGSGALRPMSDRYIDGWFYERNRYGAYACDQVDGQILGMSQLFKNGELWGIDASTIDSQTLMQHTSTNIPCFGAAVIEDVFCLALTNFLKFVRETLNITPPLVLRAGATDVHGYRMCSRNGLLGNVVEDHIVYESVIAQYDCEAPAILRPFFEHFWEECGLTRPDVEVIT